MLLSVRQVQRLKRRFQDVGVAGLAHRTRGQPSRRRLAQAVRERVATLMRTVYAGFNDCHLTEKLREVEGLRLCGSWSGGFAGRWGCPPNTPAARLAIGGAGWPRPGPAAWCCSTAAPPRGSEARGPGMTLHGAMDDATGTALALHFRPTEDLHGYAMVFDQVFTTWGLPVACYGDGTTPQTAPTRTGRWPKSCAGVQDPTHLGRVLVDLGIGAHPRPLAAGQ